MFNGDEFFYSRVKWLLRRNKITYLWVLTDMKVFDLFFFWIDIDIELSQQYVELSSLRLTNKQLVFYVIFGEKSVFLTFFSKFFSALFIDSF